MPQQIKQDVNVDFSVTGAKEAIASLEMLDQKIKSIQKNAKAMSSALGSLNKVSGASAMSKAIDQTNASLDKTASKAQRAGAMINGMQGNLSRVSASALKNQTGTIGSMRGTTGYGMSRATIARQSAARAAAVTPIPVNVAPQQRMGQATAQIGTEATKASGGMSKLKGAFDSAGKSAEKATWNFFRTRAALAAIAMVVGTIGLGMKKWFDLASDYAEANHLFYNTLASSIRDVSDEEKTASLAVTDLFGNLTGDTETVGD